jgi:methylenetetrahydrofolate reductase (NADPH)
MRSADARSAGGGSAGLAAGLAGRMHYEVVPMGSMDGVLAALPPAATVSVTCSPTKGIAPTQHVVERLIGMGHRAIPHLAARLVRDRAEVRELARWLREAGIADAFVVAGDAPVAAGPYDGAAPFVSDLLEAGAGLERVGVAGYPEGHPMLDRVEVDAHLRAKCDLLVSAGVDGWITTQMCFDPDALVSWLRRARADGVDLPVHVGVPGIVDRRRLLSLGARLGVGASLRFAGKNRAALRMLARPYDPTALVDAVVAEAGELDIEALHSFTFNAVADTRTWHEDLTARTSRLSPSGVRSPR